MEKDKILHWFVIRGKPIAGSRTRQIARLQAKKLQKTKWPDEYIYIGKVIPDPKRRGHGKIILEY